MRSDKQCIAFFLLFLFSVIVITGNISCAGKSDKNEKQAGDTTANSTNPKVSDKDNTVKPDKQNTGDTITTVNKTKPVSATQNTQQNSNNTSNTNNRTQAKTTQASTPVHTAVSTLNSQTFDATIKSGVTLVDFWATWCKPCRMEAPIVEEVNTEMAGRAKICKMDIDQNKDIASKFNIQYIPTLIIFKDGRIVKQFTGFTQKDDILGALTSQLE
jgi:thioredoxin 1